MNRWCILTNPMDERLAAMSAEFFPKGVPVVSFDGRDGLYGYEFLMKALPSEELKPYSYCIYVDTDCFVTDWDAVDMWARMCCRFGVVVSGMPDGGMISHRISSQKMPNLFLTFFNLTRIREVWDEGKIRAYTPELGTPEVNPFGRDETEDSRCEIVRAQGYIPYSCNVGCLEPYYKVFGYIFDATKTYNLPLWGDDAPEVDGDGACTRVSDNKFHPMAYHAWFAREYGKDEYHTKRINRVYDYCKGIINETE